MERDDLLKNISWEDDSEQDKDSNSTFEEGLLFFFTYFTAINC